MYRVWRCNCYFVDLNRCRFHCCLLSFQSRAQRTNTAWTFVEPVELYKRFMCFTKMECFLFNVVWHRKHLYFMCVCVYNVYRYFFSSLAFCVIYSLIFLDYFGSHGPIFKYWSQYQNKIWSSISTRIRERKKNCLFGWKLLCFKGKWPFCSLNSDRIYLNTPINAHPFHYYPATHIELIEVL